MGISSRTRLNSRVEEFTSEELVSTIINLPNLNEIAWIHFEGRIPDVLATAIPQLKGSLPQITISIEFEKPNRPGLIELLPYADVAFFSHTYFKYSDTSSPTEFFSSLRSRNRTATFILTLGMNVAAF